MNYTADFETTTKEDDCRVWAVGICTIEEEPKFTCSNNIDDFFGFAKNHPFSNFYFHNLKFDGEFIFVWLFSHGYRHVIDREEIEPKTFTTLISDSGQFYSIEICFGWVGNKLAKVKIYDSLKILPFSVSEVAKAFTLPIQKGELDYTKERGIGHTLTAEEISYLRNDVEIMARALHVLFTQNLKKMTQGSNALSDYKHILSEKNFKRWFPVLSIEHDADIRQSYKGGWTYLNPKYKNKEVGNGIVLDVNSLYPYVMYTELLPYGEPIFFEGQYEQDDLYPLYIQQITCQFEIKEDHLPTIQMKHSLSFIPTEYLTSSNGEEVVLYLTNVDLALFFEQYDVYNIEYHAGYKFKGAHDLFKDYIDKWMKVKIESTENGNKGMRTIAKLMQNSLYGKFGTNPKVCSKYPYDNNGKISYHRGDVETRKGIYIPMASFITAYARNKTIRAAQAVYDRFIYADTDSLHLVGEEVPEGLEVHPTKLGAWDLEAHFSRAKFLRQKCYIEEIEGTLKVTCAGLPKNCHDLVTWDNFTYGAVYGGKLLPKHVAGGIVLTETEFTIKSD